MNYCVLIVIICYQLLVNFELSIKLVLQPVNLIVNLVQFGFIGLGFQGLLLVCNLSLHDLDLLTRYAHELFAFIDGDLALISEFRNRAPRYHLNASFFQFLL